MWLNSILVYVKFPAIPASPTTSSNKPAPRIVGSKNATIESYPYQVALERNGSILCGGAIISPYHVLVTGFCAWLSSNESDVVRAGSDRLAEGGSVHQIREIKHHENLTLFVEPGYRANDIGLISVNEPFQLDNKTRQAIQLLEVNKPVKSGDEAITTGWGIADGESNVFP